MKEKLDTLYLLDIKRCKRHEYFLEKLEQDPLANNYLYSDFSHLSLDKKMDKIEVGNTYLVSLDGRNPIGLLRVHELSSLGILTLHYGISPEYRRKGYGSMLLEECSSYLFKNMKEVRAVELAINKENVGSIKCAKNALFQEEEERNGMKIYRKQKQLFDKF